MLQIWHAVTVSVHRGQGWQQHLRDGDIEASQEGDSATAGVRVNAVLLVVVAVPAAATRQAVSNRTTYTCTLTHKALFLRVWFCLSKKANVSAATLSASDLESAGLSQVGREVLGQSGQRLCESITRACDCERSCATLVHSRALAARARAVTTATATMTAFIVDLRGSRQ